MTDSRHVATWQPINHSETASITEQILKEMESYDREMAAINGHQKSILSEEEINKLLLPTRTQLQVDPKQIPERLLSAAGTVSGAVGTLIQSTGTAAFPRSVPPLIQAVTHLSSLAHTVPVHVSFILVLTYLLYTKLLLKTLLKL
ncbi:unnamed protein product [Diatraea saccharalis]|uniref:Uncharacterized protein n=1 Tax=Diatraea saccharalis TaxID=40085 RepID=A0A9N9RH46_9NEOP|nr:unnamed protein product [Diatraea saccharalis]